MGIQSSREAQLSNEVRLSPGVGQYFIFFSFFMP